MFIDTFNYGHIYALMLKYTYIMSLDNTRQENEFTAHFDRLEAERSYRAVIGSEIIPVEQLPIIVRLGREATNRLVITNITSNLIDPSADQSDIVGWDTTTVVDPNTFNPVTGDGQKTLQSGRDLVVGRNHKTEWQTFQPLTNYISAEHAVISKSIDGKSIIVRDLNSKNGTFIGTLPERELDTDLALFEYSDIVESEQSLVKSVHSFSLASERHPDRNEDSSIIDTKINLYAVFDGVGGVAGGDRASRAAAQFIASNARTEQEFDNHAAVTTHLDDLLRKADTEVNERTPGSATTAVVAKIYTMNDIPFVSIAHVGDSRAYLLRGGVLSAITTDHTYQRRDIGTQEAHRQQMRLADTDSIAVLSEGSYEVFRNRNVIAECLGSTRGVKVDTQHIRLLEGDAIILTSDGVHDNLTTVEMGNLLNDPEQTDYAKVLVHAANKRAKERHDRAKMDDITAVVINI
jgi:serine/threonine protein phosphatase PrpC